MRGEHWKVFTWKTMIMKTIITKPHPRRMSARDCPDLPERTTKQKEVKHMKQANTMKGKRLLRAADVDRSLVQDRSATMHIIGADVEALYPSLEAIQVADIVYNAVMETEIEFKNINYQEGVR